MLLRIMCPVRTLRVGSEGEQQPMRFNETFPALLNCMLRCGPREPHILNGLTGFSDCFRACHGHG
jgi:hypothetical protein